MACLLEDFRQLKHTDIPVKLNFLKLISRLSLADTREICGLGNGSSLFFLKNIAEDVKNTFLIDPNDYFKIFNQYNIGFCFHSHPVGPAVLSILDRELCRNSLVPFLVFSVYDENFAFHDPHTEETIYFSI